MPRVHMCGCTDPLLEDMARLPTDVYEIDFLTDFELARRTLGEERALCGNIDTISTMIEGTPEDVTAEARVCHDTAGARNIVAPGCEVAPVTPPENLRALVEFARGAA